MNETINWNGHGLCGTCGASRGHQLSRGLVSRPPRGIGVSGRRRRCHDLLGLGGRGRHLRQVRRRYGPCAPRCLGGGSGSPDRRGKARRYYRRHGHREWGGPGGLDRRHRQVRWHLLRRHWSVPDRRCGLLHVRPPRRGPS